jgi:hypothetical protein
MAAITSTIIAGAGMAMSFMAQRQQAAAAKQTANYNAELQRRQATQENMISAENIRRKTRDNNRMLAEVRASTAGRGLAMTGTPLAVLGETAMMLEREIMDASYQASTRYQSLAQGAKMTIWEGNQQARALKTQAYAGLIKGAATVGYDFAKAKGMFPSSISPSESPSRLI